MQSHANRMNRIIDQAEGDDGLIEMSIIAQLSVICKRFV